MPTITTNDGTQIYWRLCRTSHSGTSVTHKSFDCVANVVDVYVSQSK